MKIPLRVLMIDDSEDDTTLILLELRHCGFEPTFARVETAEEMRAALESQSWDLVLADYTMPRFSSPAALSLLKERKLDLPFLIVSGTIGEDRAVSAMKAGAHDYIFKGNLRRLVPAIERELRDAEERRKRKEAEAQLQQLAYYDSLTGLPNRQFFHELLSKALVRADRNNALTALLFLDLDRFKLINDTLGHAVGDDLLKAVATRIKNTLRAGDTVARLSGDEFVILVEDLTSPDDAMAFAQKLLNAQAPIYSLDGHDIFMSASIGITLSPIDGTNSHDLLNFADTAMYTAKEHGNTFQFYSPTLNKRRTEHLSVEMSLRRALDREEFLLHYQPIVQFGTAHIVGVEALIRWQHPERGLLYPESFISIAEAVGTIKWIGEWVLSMACTEVKAWQERYARPLRLAINLSPRQLYDKKLLPTVSRILSATAFDPRALELELTERFLIKDRVQNIDTLTSLQEMGIAIVIDDFGAEYSSLGYLRRLPVAGLKIDHCFVKEISTDSRDACIAQMIISLSRLLNLRVTAEGVENLEQAVLLNSKQCDYMQGNYFSPPLPAHRMRELLASHTTLWQ